MSVGNWFTLYPLKDVLKTAGFEAIPGPIGPQGDKGDKGDKGLTGPQGPQGPAGNGLNFFTTTGSTIDIISPTEATKIIIFVKYQNPTFPIAEVLRATVFNLTNPNNSFYAFNAVRPNVSSTNSICGVIDTDITNLIALYVERQSNNDPVVPTSVTWYYAFQ